MRPLLLRGRNHARYGHLIVFFAIACCPYGCAVSGGGKVSKDLNERNIAVLVLNDRNPYSWQGVEKVFTPLTVREARGLGGNC